MNLPRPPSHPSVPRILGEDRGVAIVGTRSCISFYDDSVAPIPEKTIPLSCPCFDIIRLSQPSESPLVALTEYRGYSENRPTYVYVYDLVRRTLTHRLPGHVGHIHRLSILPPSAIIASRKFHFASVGGDRSVRFWGVSPEDSENFSTLTVQLPNAGWPVGLASQAGFVVVAGGNSKNVHIVHHERAEFLKDYCGHSGFVQHVEPVDEMCFASCGNDRSVRIWDLRSDTCVRCFQMPAMCGFLLNVPDIPRLFVASGDKDPIRGIFGIDLRSAGTLPVSEFSLHQPGVQDVTTMTRVGVDRFVSAGLEEIISWTGEGKVLDRGRCAYSYRVVNLGDLALS